MSHRAHKHRTRTAPSAFFVEDDTREALLASSGRRIVVSTGKGDSRLSLDEAYALHDALWTAIHRQIEVETWENAGDIPPKPKGAK